MKILHIIPGWEDTSDRESYQKIGTVAGKKGYEVVYNNMDWKKPLSPQVFDVSEDAVVFGFSLGAILARLVAQKNPCKHLLLASMTPDYSWKDNDIKKALVDLAGSEFVEDVIENLKIENLAQKQTVFYGDKEGEKADVLVANTDHELNDEYIKEIGLIL